MTCTTHVIGAIAGTSPEQVADAQTAGVDGGEQERAVPEHHDHQGGEPNDVHGAVALLGP